MELVVENVETLSGNWGLFGNWGAPTPPGGTTEGTVITKPHPVHVPSMGYQALILCGPGVSLSTHTSNPEETPKCLIPIANRPMVYYPSMTDLSCRSARFY